MKKYLTLLSVLPSLSVSLIPTGLRAREPQIKVEQALQTTQSWDNNSYPSYPTGQPQVAVGHAADGVRWNGLPKKMRVAPLASQDAFSKFAG